MAQQTKLSFSPLTKPWRHTETNKLIICAYITAYFNRYHDHSSFIPVLQSLSWSFEYEHSYVHLTPCFCSLKGSKIRSLWHITQYAHFCRIRNRGGEGRGQSVTDNFEGQNWLQQTIYHWKGNFISLIHFRYRQNILISRFYEQFSRNCRNLGHFGSSKKYQTHRTCYISF